MKTHDLFPLDGSETEGQKAMEIASIHVRRLENGKFTYCPTNYQPEALESLEALYSLHGGGDYILEARDADKRFCRTRRLQLPGPSKPLSADATPAPAAAPPPASAPGMSESMMMMAMFDRMMQLQQTSSQNNQALILGILNRGETASAQISERRAELERQSRLEHNQFLQTMLETAKDRGAGEGGEFVKGLEFAQGLFSEMMEKNAQTSDNPDDFMASLLQFMQGIGALGKQNAGGAGNGAPGANVPG
jgi:hypothetical protein